MSTLQQRREYAAQSAAYARKLVIIGKNPLMQQIVHEVSVAEQSAVPYHGEYALQYEDAAAVSEIIAQLEESGLGAIIDVRNTISSSSMLSSTRVTTLRLLCVSNKLSSVALRERYLAMRKPIIKTLAKPIIKTLAHN